MGWLFKEKQKKQIEEVFLIMPSGRKKVKVEWFGDILYAKAFQHGDDTYCKLCPAGKAYGPCYVYGWEPITEKTQEYYSKKGK